MTQNGRIALAASILLSGALAAQEPIDPVRAAAARDAERFASCFMSGDLECFEELNYWDPYQESGILSRDSNALMVALAIESARAPGLDESGLVRAALRASSFRSTAPGDYFWMELAEPWSPFAVGSALHAYVPYFASFEDPASGRRVDRMSYLIGHSANAGESWRFFPVRHDLSSNEIDRVIPGLGDVPRPEFRDVVIKESRPERSRWLTTTFRQIVPADNAYFYVLEFEIREVLAMPIAITVRYDNPSNPDELSSFRGSLEPGQTELRWQSPPLVGFEADRTYNVVIEGGDPDTGSLLFEHREELLIPPTRELWRSAMSKAPAGQP